MRDFGATKGLTHFSICYMLNMNKISSMLRFQHRAQLWWFLCVSLLSV